MSLSEPPGEVWGDVFSVFCWWKHVLDVMDEEEIVKYLSLPRKERYLLYERHSKVIGSYMQERMRDIINDTLREAVVNSGLPEELSGLDVDDVDVDINVVKHWLDLIFNSRNPGVQNLFVSK